MPLIDRIEKINLRKRAKSMMTFDFTTLYTKIPHHLLLEALNEIIDFSFNGGTARAVYVSKYGASWRHSADSRAYNVSAIKRAVKYAIENAYFQVGDNVFRQTIGIPIGSDPAPFFANLFLYVYESRFISNLLKVDRKRAFKFRHVFRFIDDLSALNDEGEFSKSFHEIYPKEMELKQENKTETSASYLELAMAIEDRQIMTNLYDKRDAFGFSVVRLPYKCSNIPSKMFYSTITAEVLRIAKATSKYVYFLLNVRKLLLRMKNQGADNFGIRKFLRKMMNRHLKFFIKFSKSTEDVILDCCGEIGN